MTVSSFIWIIILIVSIAGFSYCSIDDFRRLSEYENAKLQIECGIRENYKSKSRISYGERAKQGQFPWAVMIYANGNICSGSIISPYHVVTAAHCFIGSESGIVNEDVSKFMVLAGSVCFQLPYPFTNCSIDGQSSEPPGLIIPIKRIIIPRESLMFELKYFRVFGRLDPKFEEMLPNMTPEMIVSFFSMKYHNFNDIALLELQTPLVHGSLSFLPVCIPPLEIRIPENVQIYGYGVTEEFVLNKDIRNSRLYYLDQYNIWSLNNCLKREYEEICDRALFSFPQRGDPRTPCGGDSGGGIVGSVGNKNFIFGISSKGLNYCTHTNSPFFYALFSRVTFDLDFICYYTGICPKGYNKYMDKNYENHPQPVAYVSDGQGPPIIGPDNLVVRSEPKINNCDINH